MVMVVVVMMMMMMMNKAMITARVMYYKIES
jgi:hypothetical protein